uniref:Bm13553 n=1 Tax=Brugia malayi TaxID=6279 RepID=A0A1I9G4Y8_BRUMA|nr:Bm13553 [Brugia malayi]
MNNDNSRCWHNLHYPVNVMNTVLAKYLYILINS